MTCSVVALGDVECLGLGVVDRLVNLADAHEHLQVRSEEIESDLDFGFGIIGFHRCRNDGDAKSLSANGMSR